MRKRFEVGEKERKQYLLVRAGWHTKSTCKEASFIALLHLAKLSGERTCKCVEIEGGGNKSKGDQKDNP